MVRYKFFYYWITLTFDQHMLFFSESVNGFSLTWYSTSRSFEIIFDFSHITHCYHTKLLPTWLWSYIPSCHHKMEVDISIWGAKIGHFTYQQEQIGQEMVRLMYCSDVCSGTTCHKGNEISSGRNDYWSPFF